jgi:MFS family permease
VILVGVFAATWIPVFVPLVHLAAFTRDLGHPLATGAWATGAIGGGAAFGRLGMGWISDRFGRRPTLAIGLGVEIVAFAALAGAHGLTVLVAEYHELFSTCAANTPTRANPDTLSLIGSVPTTSRLTPRTFSLRCPPLNVCVLLIGKPPIVPFKLPELNHPLSSATYGLNEYPTNNR